MNEDKDALIYLAGENEKGTAMTNKNLNKRDVQVLQRAVKVLGKYLDNAQNDSDIEHYELIDGAFDARNVIEMIALIESD